MSDNEKQLISELSKKYVFETFDFNNNSPEDLLRLYQETYLKIEKVIEEQNAKITEESLALFDRLNY